MGRHTGALKYGAKAPVTNPINIYIHGGAILSVITLTIGFLNSGSFAEAIDLVLNFYIGKLLPWPLYEVLTAKGITDLIISHLITIGVGTASATSRWWASMS